MDEKNTGHQTAQAFVPCGIRHRHGDQRCARARNHLGLCRSRAYRSADGLITWSEWFSTGGLYKSHWKYHTVRPGS